MSLPFSKASISLSGLLDLRRCVLHRPVLGSQHGLQLSVPSLAWGLHRRRAPALFHDRGDTGTAVESCVRAAHSRHERQCPPRKHMQSDGARCSYRHRSHGCEPPQKSLSRGKVDPGWEEGVAHPYLYRVGDHWYEIFSSQNSALKTACCCCVA